jgi:16S rRNA (guanine527-N7)-methyltransferase
MEWDELPELFPRLDHPARWLPLLRAHLDLVIEAETHTRVTSVAHRDSIQRHYAESLETWELSVGVLGGDPVSVVDVGSGGGYPGIVMACIAPETEFALVEPLQKRARLLEAEVEALGLKNVKVYAERAEDAGKGPLRGKGDLVIARAVASLSALLEYTSPFAKVGGSMILPKGSAFPGELEAAHQAMAILGCAHRATLSMRPQISEAVVVAHFVKTAETPAMYPRRAGTPGKSPL